MWAGSKLDVSGEPAAESDWRFYQQRLIKNGLPYLVEARLTMAALVSCSFGVGSLKWAKDRLTSLLTWIADHDIFVVVRRYTLPASPFPEFLLQPLACLGVRSITGLTRHEARQFACIQQF